MGSVTQDKPARKPAVRKPTANAKGKANQAGAAALLQAAASPTAAGQLPLDVIDAEHFTNPRGPVDQQASSFAELQTSIAELGVLQPIVVGPALVEGGKHPIVAGWRRHAAAIAAGHEAIPVRQVTITAAKDALVAGLAENVARDDMTPLAEARAIDTLMREHGYTQVKAGKTVGMAERTVRERLRLLKIHEASPLVGAAISSGEVPMDAAVTLQAIAAAAPTVAATLVKLATDPPDEDLYDPIDLTSVDDIVNVLAHGDELLADETIVPFSANNHHGGRTRGEDLPLSDKQLERWQQIPPHDYTSSPPNFEFDQADVKAAKDAGCLIELQHKTPWGAEQTTSFICGREFVAGRLENKLVAMEREGVKRTEAREVVRKRQAMESGKPGAPGLTKAEHDKASKVKAKAARDAEIAHHRNVLLGERATPEVFASVALSLPAAKLLALLITDHADGLAARGLRYCDPDHLEEKQRKNGSVKRKYELDGDLGTLVREKVVAATTPGEAIAPALRAYALAVQADQQVTSQSNRAYWSLPGTHSYGAGAGAHIPKLLDEVLEQTGILTDIDQEAKRRADAPPPGKPLAQLVDPPASPTKTATTGQTIDERALAEITAKPGITIPELAAALEVSQNRLYRVLPEMTKAGKLSKQGRGWHPVAGGEA